MASSGNFPTNNSNIVYWIEAIQNSQNIGANTSNVTVRVWVKRTNSGYTTYGTGTVYVTINGSNYTDSLTTSDKITSSPLKIFERTVNVSHNSDGSKTLGLSARISHSVFSASSHSWNFGLTTIPRTSKPTVNDSTINYGSAVTIYTNRASGSFTHTLRYNWNGRTGTIATGVTTSHSWTIPTSFMNYIPSSTSTKGTIYCDTYNGSSKIGTESIAITTSVPSNVVPSFSAVTHSENVSGVSSKIGAYVQGLSKLNLGITGASGTYGSSISKYEITFNGVTYTGSSAVSSLIKNSGTLTITGKVTDSRGRTASKSVSVTVLAYEAPKITGFKIERANSDGTLNEMGIYAKVSRAGSWRSLNSKNSVSIVIKSKPRGSSTWTTNDTVAAGTGGSYNASVVFGTFDVTKSYDFRVEFVDQFNTTIALGVMATGGVTMSWAPNGIGVGKIWEKGALDVGGDIYCNNIIASAATPYFHGRNASSQSIPTSAYTAITSPNVLTNQGGGTMSTSGVYTIPEDGIYLIHAQIGFSNAVVTGKAFHLALFLNGSIGEHYRMFYSNPSGSYVQCIGVTVLSCSRGQTIETRVYQDTGVSLSSIAGNSSLRIMKVGKVA